MLPAEIGRAIRAFMSENCPACGEQKHRRADPFCPECLHRLPDPLIERLSQKEHFIQAFGPAMEQLA